MSLSQPSPLIKKWLCLLFCMGSVMCWQSYHYDASGKTSSQQHPSGSNMMDCDGTFVYLSGLEDGVESNYKKPKATKKSPVRLSFIVNETADISQVTITQHSTVPGADQSAIRALKSGAYMTKYDFNSKLPSPHPDVLAVEFEFSESVRCVSPQPIRTFIGPGATNDLATDDEPLHIPRSPESIKAMKDSALSLQSLRRSERIAGEILKQEKQMLLVEHAEEYYDSVCRRAAQTHDPYVIGLCQGSYGRYCYSHQRYDEGDKHYALAFNSLAEATQDFIPPYDVGRVLIMMQNQAELMKFFPEHRPGAERLIRKSIELAEGYTQKHPEIRQLSIETLEIPAWQDLRMFFLTTGNEAPVPAIEAKIAALKAGRRKKI